MYETDNYNSLGCTGSLVLLAYGLVVGLLMAGVLCFLGVTL